MMILASPARPVLSIVSMSRSCRCFSSLIKQNDRLGNGFDLSLASLSSNPQSADRRIRTKQPPPASWTRRAGGLKLNPIKQSDFMATHGFRRTEPLLLFEDPLSRVSESRTLLQSVDEGLQKSGSTTPGDGTSSSPAASGLPNKVPPEKLQYVFNELEKNLPRFFVRTHPYTLYDKDMIFEDHIRGIYIKGLRDYAINLMMIKMNGSILYAKVTFNVLKMTMHPEDGTIRVRWQIEGVQGWRYLLTFWRYGLFRRFFGNPDEPYVSTKTDGFSIFYLNSQGLICKHLCDKMMPDTSGQPNPVTKSALPV